MSSVASEADPDTRFRIQVVYVGVNQESREGGNEPGKRLRPLRDVLPPWTAGAQVWWGTLGDQGNMTQSIPAKS